MSFKNLINSQIISEGVLKDGSIKGKEKYSPDVVKKWFIDNYLKKFKTGKEFLETLKTQFNSNFYMKDIKILENLGYIKKEGKEIQIILKPIENNSQTKATKIKDLSKGKVKKLKIPQSKSGDKLENFVETVILHMFGNEAGKLLLVGDPGTGKSRTVEQIATLLKMNFITIEAPHVSEEAIINIPYVIRRGLKEEIGSMDIKSKGENSFEVVNAESNLVTKIKRLKPITDQEYQKFLNAHKMLIPLANKYKQAIEEIHKKFDKILFIDEYFRTGSRRVQNLMRTILNGNIGDTPIPKDVYIIFASNMDNSDGSLDDINLNQQFQEIDFDKPSKEDFMRYIADKFTTFDVNTGEEDPEKQVENPIKPEVYNAFMDALTDKDLGGRDMSTEAEIRVSPRRWEEIIKYVNANLPVKDEQEARNLLTFLKVNMTDYVTGETSSLFDKYSKVVKDLIKTTSGIDADNIPLNTKKEWRETLRNEIETKLKLGEERKYVPIVSGMPGIGKTKIIESIAKQRNLKQITIDASTLNSDDVIGLTVPEGDEQQIVTKFTKPPLYRKIMSQYDPDLKPEGNSKYTHILFIDEISRTTKKVFNAIRSLMLDKKVGSEKLPDDIMIIAAMNPKDVGTEELPEHFKDVVDVISSEADFNDFLNYIANKKTLIDYNKTIGFDLLSLMIENHKNITSLFESDVDADGNDIDDFNTRKYYWAPDNINVFYVSPREMDDMISGSINDSVKGLVLFKQYDKNNRYEQPKLQEFTDFIGKKTVEKYRSVLNFVAVRKGEVDKDSFEKMMMGIEDKVSDLKIKIFDAFNTIKSEMIPTVQSVFENVNYDIDKLLAEPAFKPTFENILENADVDEVKFDFMSVIDNMIKNDSPAQLFEDLIKMWKLLSQIDWTKFNSEITANLSVIFVKRGFQPVLKRIVEEHDEELAEEIGKVYEKYAEEVDIMSNRAKDNIYNMFVKAKS